MHGYAQTDCADCEVSVVVACRVREVQGNLVAHYNRGIHRNVPIRSCKDLLENVDRHVDNPGAIAAPTCS